MSRNSLLSTASAFALVLGAQVAIAADVVRPPTAVVAPKPLTLPAVSQINAKIAAFGGSIDNVSGWGLAGAVSVPLGQRFGLQVDTLAGTGGGTEFWGLGGHLFWRDPSKGLIGAYGSWVDWSSFGAKVSKVGIEGEAYMNRLSLEGVLAYQGGSFTGVAGSVTAAWYPADNFRLQASYRFLQGVGSIGGVAVEFSPRFNNRPSALAVFASGDWGQTGFQTFLGGVKLYAGPQKDLIRRHREDDPGLLLPWDLHMLPPVATPIVCQVDQVCVIDQ